MPFYCFIIYKNLNKNQRPGNAGKASGPVLICELLFSVNHRPVDLISMQVVFRLFG